MVVSFPIAAIGGCIDPRPECARVEVDCLTRRVNKPVGGGCRQAIVFFLAQNLHVIAAVCYAEFEWKRIVFQFLWERRHGRREERDEDQVCVERIANFGSSPECVTTRRSNIL